MGGNKLIFNFIKLFDFRLSEEWDLITDSNADELCSKYQGVKFITPQISSTSTKNKMDTDNANDDDDDEEEEKKNDEEEEPDEIRDAAVAKFKEVVSAHDDGDGKGIGSAVWFLCKLLVDSKPNEDTDAPPK